MGCSVMSVTHKRSGWGLAKSRSTRAAAVATFAVFRHLGRPEMPRSPALRISVSTVWWHTATPRPPASPAWTRLAP